MTRPAIGASFEGTDALAILQTYVDAWKGTEEFALEANYIIGSWIDGASYSVELTSSSATLLNDEPNSFDWWFETDTETLKAISSGRLNALTAMGQARASDPIPLRPRLPDNFDPSRLRDYHILLLQSFWNREWPEAVPFGEGVTREVHGANTTALIYDKGLRTAWYQLKPGMHINADPSDQVNDFETAIIVTRGRFIGVIGGTPRRFEEGETVRIQEGVTHEFYANEGEYGEFIILMWGDGA